MKKLKCILLIDDDEITNFINKDILESMQISESIHIAENGKEALDYLNEAYSGNSSEKYPSPEIIFLDLNMPVMDGFEFLHNFKEEFQVNNRCKLIIMLTTSLRGEDIERALQLKVVVTDYIEKPLSEEKVANILKLYFDANYEVKSNKDSAK